MEKKEPENKTEEQKKPETKRTDASESPEKLNEYIRIGSAGGVFLIAGLVLVVAALIIWGFVGRIPITTKEKCVIVYMDSGKPFGICLIDYRENIGVLPLGTEVTARMPSGNTYFGHIEYMDLVPNSEKEVRELLDGLSPYAPEWVLENIIKEDTYSYIVNFALDIDEDEDISDDLNLLGEVTIVLEKVRPISFLIE